MGERRFFIFGAGYSAKAFARANDRGAPVLGTTRALVERLERQARLRLKVLIEAERVAAVAVA